ncbi:alpha-ketoglutarate-dependent dioxygenase AlkB family protein [Biformimicrobium ophioploci]|uniref:alpha-ketoglutarate-dependent dioxygenase AlkB family protein n=1 Tax=Biformimicrobium ophioploci TaxID=3036711 RepID=UPI0025521A80|nr:alpha-ketoglutarate-dependent dioxygenase AlkB [Microbulbifer sp. NKW57]
MDEVAFGDAISGLAACHEGATTPGLSPGKALYIPHWVSPHEAGVLLHALLQSHLQPGASGPEWSQPELRLFGKSHPIPRLHAFVGDQGVSYRWSGLVQRAQPWPAALVPLRSRLQAAGFQFNAVLLNLYRDGVDSMGLHADNEPELGASPVVATVSLGAARPLRFRPNPSASGAGRTADGSRYLDLDLDHGSLLLTSGLVQQAWKHELPRRKRVGDPRISLTFRYICQ